MLDYRRKEAELLADTKNPVALFVLAWLEGRRLSEDYEKILAARVRLIRALSRFGLALGEANRWLGYFHWFLWLPREYCTPGRADQST
jgi:hypothetical protein